MIEIFNVIKCLRFEPIVIILVISFACQMFCFEINVCAKSLPFVSIFAQQVSICWNKRFYKIYYNLRYVWMTNVISTQATAILMENNTGKKYWLNVRTVCFVWTFSLIKPEPCKSLNRQSSLPFEFSILENI